MDTKHVWRGLNSGITGEDTADIRLMAGICVKIWHG